MTTFRTTLLLTASLLAQAALGVATAHAGWDPVGDLQRAADNVRRGADSTWNQTKEHNPDLAKAEAIVTGVVRTVASPDTLRECWERPLNCPQHVLAAPVAGLAATYMADLEYQAQGRLSPFSNEFVNLAQSYYPEINLRAVLYADGINTYHGQNVGYCNRIYFTPASRGNLWQDKSQLRLVLHELEHVVQCNRRGADVFLAEYVVKAAADVVKHGRVDVHDVHDFEVAADAKADQLTDMLWNKIQSGSVARPGAQMNFTSNSPANFASNPPAGRVCRNGMFYAFLMQPQPLGASCFVPNWGWGVTSSN